MKKRYWWMTACFVLLVSGIATFWFFTADKITDDLQTDDNATAQEAPKPAKIKSSPILGKEIPGLPEYCADKLISASGCDGITEITTDQGNTYRLVEIGGQCWFADNLRIETNRFSSSGYDSENAIFTWNSAMHKSSRGKSTDSCPLGWHIPSKCEFHYIALENVGYRKLGPLSGENIKNLKTGFVWKDDPRVRMFWTSTLSPCPGQKSCPLAVAISKDSDRPIKFTPIGHDKTAMPVRCIRS